MLYYFTHVLVAFEGKLALPFDMAAPPQFPGPQTLLPLPQSQLHPLLFEALYHIDQLNELGELVRTSNKATPPTIATTSVVAKPYLATD